MASHVRILTGGLVATFCAGALLVACGGGEGTTTTTTTTGEGTSGGMAAADAGATGMSTEGADAGAPAEPTPPPPPANASVRVIHASPDPAAADVAIYLDGAATPAVPHLAYKAAVGYTDLPAGAHAVAIRPAAAAATSAPAAEAHTPDLVAGHHYTLIAQGLAGHEPALNVAAVEDNGEQPEAGHARVRFYHAFVGTPAVDICLPGANARAAGTPVFPNVAFGAWGAPAGGQNNYADVPSGHEITLQIRAQNAAHPCTGAVQGHVAITPTDRGVMTVVATGHRGGHPAVAGEVLVCHDAPEGTATCAAMPIAAH